MLLQVPLQNTSTVIKLFTTLNVDEGLSANLTFKLSLCLEKQSYPEQETFLGISADSSSENTFCSLSASLGLTTPALNLQQQTGFQ